MKITIGSTTFDATSCTRRRDNAKGYYLDMTIPTENISKDTLYDLLDGNTESIIATEGDGTESTYDGFNAIGNFSVSKGLILVSQYCTSELEAQLSLAKNKIAEQDKTIVIMQNEAQAMTAEILGQAETIVLQGETIATQNETITSQKLQIAELAEMSKSQLDAIDYILTEGFSTVAQEAATMAVEQALAAIEETEEEVEENTEPETEEIPVEETSTEETTEEE